MSNCTPPKCLQSFIKMNKHNNNENSTASSSSPRNLNSKLLIILSLCHGVIYIFPCRGVRKACSFQRKGCSIVAFYSVYHNILGRNGYDSICTGEGNFVQAAIEASNIHIWAGSDKRSATINATIAPMQWCQLFLGKWIIWLPRYKHCYIQANVSLALFLSIFEVAKEGMNYLLATCLNIQLQQDIEIYISCDI